MKRNTRHCHHHRTYTLKQHNDSNNVSNLYARWGSLLPLPSCTKGEHHPNPGQKHDVLFTTADGLDLQMEVKWLTQPAISVKVLTDETHSAILCANICRKSSFILSTHLPPASFTTNTHHFPRDYSRSKATACWPPACTLMATL